MNDDDRDDVYDWDGLWGSWHVLAVRASARMASMNDEARMYVIVLLIALLLLLIGGVAAIFDR